MMHFAGEQK